MSYWKAYAKASDVADADLRRELIATYETVFELAELLESKPEAIVDAVCALQDDVKGAQEETEQAQAAAAEAEERLENKLSEDEETELGKLRTECERLRAELNGAYAQKGVENAYADCLAMARKFVSAAEGAGIKAKRARKVAP